MQIFKNKSLLWTAYTGFRFTIQMVHFNALFCIFWGYAVGIHIHTPENIATVVGSPVSMSCGTDANQSVVLWYFQSSLDNQEILIFNGNIGLSRYPINRNNFGICEIRIDNVTTLDSGTYRCVLRMRVMGGTETIAEFKSDLIVFGAPTLCSTNSSVGYQGRIGDTLLLYCTVNYTGNWSPYLEWSRNDDMNITSRPLVIQRNTNVMSTLILSLNLNDNDVTFSCKTAFTQEKEIQDNQVTFVPTYQFIWNFTATVLFGPQAVVITPRSESYSPNDKLYCGAKGNPNPSCIWIDLDTKRELAKDCLLIIDENMKPDQMYNFQCKTENTVSGVRAHRLANITFRIRFETDTCRPTCTLSRYSVIGIAVGMFTGSILISFIVTSKRKRLKQNCRDRTSEEHSTEVPNEYDSISDANIQTNRLGTVIESRAAEDENEGNKEEAELKDDTFSTSVSDAVDNLVHEPHSHLVAGRKYSSLKGRETTPHPYDAYSQIGAQTTSVAYANEGETQNDIE